jgi:hypothetical protein
MEREPAVAVAATPSGFFTQSAVPSHIIGPDVSHHQGHITEAAWRSCLDHPWVRFAGCKVSQGNNFTDPEASWNINQVLAAVDRGDVDFGKFYIWPNTGQSVTETCNLFCRVVGDRLHHPGFVFDLDVEGGTRTEVNSIMEEMQQRMGGPERTLVYGGAFIRYTLGDPLPSQVPALARAGFKIVPKYGECCPTRPKYIQDSDILWQYTDVVYGPADRANYPRQVGQMKCDFSTQLGTAAQYGARVARLPGQREEDMTPAETEALIKKLVPALVDAELDSSFVSRFGAAFAEGTGFQPKDAGYWDRLSAGIGDVVRGVPKRGLPEPYSAAFDWAASLGHSEGVPPHEHVVTGKAA